MSATGGTFTYDTTPHAGSGSATGVGTDGALSPVTFSYVGVSGTVSGTSASAPVNAGSYTLTASFAGNGNYNAKSSTPAALTINKADPAVSATGGTFTYDTTPHAGSGSATGVGTDGALSPVTFSYVGVSGTVSGTSASAPVNAGSYTLTASFAGNGNYNAKSSTPAALTINKADPAVSATGGTFTYDTTPHAGSGSATGVGTDGALSPVTFSYVGVSGTVSGTSASAPVNAGSYTLTASFAGNGNYNAKSSTPAALTINKADPAVSATGGTFTYDTTPHAGSGSATGVGTDGALSPVTFSYVGVSGTVSGTSASAPVNAGSYTLTASFAGNGNYNAKSSTPAALTINKADPAVSATGGTFTYDTTPHAGSGSATGVGTDGALSPVTFSYVGVSGTVYPTSASAPVNAGSYTLTASFAGNGNYNAKSSTPAALTINKADPAVSATGGTFTYDTTPHAGSGSATGVGTDGALSPVTFSY